MATKRNAKSGGGGRVLVGVSGGLLVTSAGLIAAHVLLGGSGAQAATEGARRTASPNAQPVDTAALLDERITVKVAGAAVPLRRADLGFIVDETAAKTESRSPLSIDRERAAAAIADLKSHHDQAATEASLDLEQRTIRADQPGRGIDVYGSLAALSVAARTGATEVELVTVELPARTRAADLGIDDISTVIGHWSTKFSVSDRERVFNLKLAASKLNGYVLQPGVEFSFNDVVGERTEKQGYKVAHVISAGEMVDGLAGGTCQISTTLFAASFFAGLDIVSQTPHSRPSVYASLGLDATVVYPTTDLKLKNSFDFPVVIHYKVAAGEAVVELLGKERPYDKVTFERTITSRTPYTSEERLDDTIIADQTSLDQPGFDGYRISRVRRMFKDGVEVKTEKASVGYRPVTEYVRRGTSTDPNAKPASTAVPKMPSVPHGGVEVITQ